MGFSSATTPGGEPGGDSDKYNAKMHSLIPGRRWSAVPMRRVSACRASELRHPS